MELDEINHGNPKMQTIFRTVRDPEIRVLPGPFSQKSDG